ncbi:hypothetical protein SRHO_G00181360, partial [Serrasalmus rhombeus]
AARELRRNGRTQRTKQKRHNQQQQQQRTRAGKRTRLERLTTKRTERTSLERRSIKKKQKTANKKKEKKRLAEENRKGASPVCTRLCLGLFPLVHVQSWKKRRVEPGLYMKSRARSS